MGAVEKTHEPLDSTRQRTVLDLACSLLAVAGITAAVLADLPVRTSAFAASDFKTLYASAWCFRHGLDAYSFPNLQAVFSAQRVVPPTSWFGHAPVYPPTTLALLAPLTLLPMVPAAYLATILSALLFALAIAALARYAAQVFGLGLPFRLVLIAICAACPLLAFALSVGNLSPAAAALSILAFTHPSTRTEQGSVWPPSFALALALLLKPHMAVWVLIAMLLLTFGRSRAVALRALPLCLTTGLAAAALLSREQLPGQYRSFFRVFGFEMAPGGSMHLSSREALPVVAQITSLRSLLGFWTPENPLTFALAALTLLGFAGLLLYRIPRLRTEAEASLAVAAAAALGLLATYHRAHDATLLLLALPYLLYRLKSHPPAWGFWIFAALLLALSLGPQVDRIAQLAQGTRQPHSLPAFLALRQASLASLGLLALLTALLLRSGRAHPRVI